MNTNSVNLFLTHFKEKMKVFDVRFRADRGKNNATLAELEINIYKCIKVLENLKIEDYSEGPIEDKLNYYGEMWVFGKIVKGREVYIKISIGKSNSNAICISFHIAEHPMTYPLKT